MLTLLLLLGLGEGQINPVPAPSTLDPTQLLLAGILAATLLKKGEQLSSVFIVF